MKHKIAVTKCNSIFVEQNENFISMFIFVRPTNCIYLNPKLQLMFNAKCEARYFNGVF